MDFTNNNVYSFLLEECKAIPNLMSIFGKGISERTKDAAFWEKLSEQIDCFRVCDECGTPMIEGYILDGCEVYCCEECLHNHVTTEEYNELYNDGNGNSYYTTWYENSITFNRK